MGTLYKKMIRSLETPLLKNIASNHTHENGMKNHQDIIQRAVYEAMQALLHKNRLMCYRHVIKMDDSKLVPNRFLYIIC